jgi:SAM-dependent methyltransferase
MNNREPYSTYDNFAWFYDKYWGKWTGQVLPAFEKVFFPHIPERGLILDLCCGQGQMAAALTDMGYRVIGVDGSEEMLRYARCRAPKVTFIHADAQAFVVPEKCDAALSTYDSLNHIMTLEGLTSAFACVRKALKPGAPFLFDLNIDEGFKGNWQGSFGKVEDDNAIIARGSYDPEAAQAELALTMFRLTDGKWNRSDLVIPEKCYTDAEVTATLEETSFTEIQQFNSAKDFGAKSAGRDFWLARAR